MAIFIQTLNGGNITIGSSGGGSTPETRTATRVWYGDNENVYTDYEIVGAIEGIPPTSGEPGPTTQITNVTSAKKIEIGSTVTSIGDFAFMSCEGLTSVTISASVTSIGNYAFFNCNGLNSIIIPSSVDSISSNPFGTSLNNITFQGKTCTQVQAMTNYPFGLNNGNIGGVTIHCSDGDIQIQNG